MVQTPLQQLTQLFDLYVADVYTVAHRTLWNRSDAEDVVQTTFLRAFTHLDQRRDPTKDRSWLLTIAYRESVAVIRKRRDIPTDPTLLSDGPDTAQTPEQIGIQRALVDRVQEAIASLPETVRIAVVLRDIEELPMAEVATILDLGPSAAKMRVARGRELLRTYLQEELNDL